VAKDLHAESLYVPVGGTDELHLRHFWIDSTGPPVLFVHGSIENGRIFYSHSGRGLAPFLARQGFDCFVADLRGRGESRPPISRSSRYGQTEAIVQDLAALANAIEQLRGEVAQHWVAHSWGGVLVSSHLARFPARIARVASLTYFGVKRRILVRNLARLVMIDLGWRGIHRLAAALVGYLPARRLGFGSDNETRRSHAQCRAWVRDGPWIDPADGFDYGSALRAVSLPRCLYLAAVRDRCLGNPNDVQAFIAESGAHHHHFRLLARANGNLHDYDHISMLTHPDAERDHFPLVSTWISTGKV
jgi:pimeloyl-ACP methyl ester carboxylesterase